MSRLQPPAVGVRSGGRLHVDVVEGEQVQQGHISIQRTAGVGLPGQALMRQVHDYTHTHTVGW